MDEKKEKRCNFCGKPEHLVEGMISAADVNICSECVTYCYEMLYGHVGTLSVRIWQRLRWQCRCITTISESSTSPRTSPHEMWNCKRATSCCWAPLV